MFDDNDKQHLDLGKVYIVFIQFFEAEFTLIESIAITHKRKILLIYKKERYQDRRAHEPLKNGEVRLKYFESDLNGKMHSMSLIVL